MEKRKKKGGDNLFVAVINVTGLSYVVVTVDWFGWFN